MEDGKVKVAASDVFQNLLKGSATAEEVKEHYESRVQGKRVQLANPSRPRPRPSHGSKEAVKLAERQTRAAQGLRKARGEGSNTRDSMKKQVRTSKPRPRGIEGLDEDLSYHALLPLADFWTTYFQQFAGLVRGETDAKTGQVQFVPNPSTLKVQNSSEGATSWKVSDFSIAHIQQQAAKADLVGGGVEVIRAGNPSLVGLKGIIAKETERTFIIAHCEENGTTPEHPTPEHRRGKGKRAFKVIPKHNTTLMLKVALPPVDPLRASGTMQLLHIPLQGNQMEGAMVTRATRKWKQRKTMEF